MPDASNNPTFGDALTPYKRDVAHKADTLAAALAADAADRAADASLAASTKALAADLDKVPAGFEIDANGVVTVYIADTSPAGFHAFQPVPITAPIPPDAPAPPTPAS